MKHFIYHFTSILHGLIRTHKWPAPSVSGFIAQLVRASHRYREVTGSNPIEVLTFSGFCTQLLKLITWFQNPQFNIWNILYITSHSFLPVNLWLTNLKIHLFIENSKNSSPFSWKDLFLSSDHLWPWKNQYDIFFFAGLEITPVRLSGTSTFSPRASNFVFLLAPRARAQASRSRTKFFIMILRRKGKC